MLISAKPKSISFFSHQKMRNYYLDNYKNYKPEILHS